MGRGADGDEDEEDLPERVQDHSEEYKFAQEWHDERGRRNDFGQQQEEHSQGEQNGYAE